jgi:hypothetical protein
VRSTPPAAAARGTSSTPAPRPPSRPCSAPPPTRARPRAASRAAAARGTSSRSTRTAAGAERAALRHKTGRRPDPLSRPLYSSRPDPPGHTGFSVSYGRIRPPRALLYQYGYIIRTHTTLARAVSRRCRPAQSPVRNSSGRQGRRLTHTFAHATGRGCTRGRPHAAHFYHHLISVSLFPRCCSAHRRRLRDADPLRLPTLLSVLLMVARWSSCGPSLPHGRSWTRSLPCHLAPVHELFISHPRFFRSSRTSVDAYIRRAAVLHALYPSDTDTRHRMCSPTIANTLRLLTCALVFCTLGSHLCHRLVVDFFRLLRPFWRHGRTWRYLCTTISSLLPFPLAAVLVVVAVSVAQVLFARLTLLSALLTLTRWSSCILLSPTANDAHDLSCFLCRHP